MATLIIDEEIELKKTHFKTYNELKMFLSSNKSLSNSENTNLVGWTDNEIKEFEKQNTIEFLEKIEKKEGDVNWDEVFIKGTKYNN